MTVLSGILIGLATGVVFGFALEKSRVFEPGVIVGQMQLRSTLMLKVFLAAVATGLLVLAVMNGVYGVKLSLKPLLWRADIIGGLILGVGITISGACPGTSLAQLGAGYRDAFFVVLGGIAGAIAYGYNDAAITKLFAESGQKLGFDKLLGMPFWLTAVILAAVLIVVLVALEIMLPWRSEVGDDHDGVTDRHAGRLVAAE
ncbi:MAG TPA: YeeE/YedE thiosulfate transporter family protein [Hyphomicrobiaceae bacterium]|nr:YeeE/YedE thiosulfate transporter family protein [Hyphomicrobiaceae bacterium]